MAGKTGKHLAELNKKRAITVRTLKQSEKAISDSERLKREAESQKAASLWRKGYDRETRE